jgi:DNA-binding CsgD family transcriptional regulator
VAVHESAPPLLGRFSEQETLRQLVANVRGGQSAVLVVRGEAGIGKTALLRYLTGQASGFTVARAVGVESEMELPFAGLHQLCAPMLSRHGSLAEPQRRGLSVAFGLVAGDNPDRFLVALAALGLMAEISEERPLLCVVDDAQWLDQASAQVLGFVGRRLLAESVALVFAARTASGDDTSPDHLAGLPGLQLAGLGNEPARALLATVAPGPLDQSVRARIIEETRGNPLALLELNRGLGAAELAGGFALPDAGDLPRRIENQYIERIGELPPEAQQMALLAAADPVGDAALVFRAARLLGLDAGAANPAVAAGLLSVGANVRFRHPLVRSAVYRAAAARDRRAAHGALAAATDSGTDPDRRAWHRAHATAGPDETVAGELIGSAGRALRRGGVAAAAAFWERAVVLTPDPAERAARALEAAGAKYAAGDFEAAQALLAAAEVGPLSELSHALVQRMRAQVTFALRRGSDAPPLLLRAAQRLEDLDASLARQTYLEALVAAVYVGRLGHRQDVVDIARAAGSARTLDPGDGELTPSVLLLRGLAVRLADGYTAAAPLLSEALRRYRARPQELDWLCVAGNLVAMDMWDDQAWFELATSQVRLARANGTLSWLPFALDYLAEIQIQAGELSAAAALLAEGERIDPGIRAATLPYVSLLLAAWRGDAQTSAELTEEMVRGARDRGEGAALTVAEYATAVLYNGLGDYQLAADAADRASAHGELVISPWALYELVEAAVRSGERERAAEAAEQLSEIAAASGTDWARGAAARSLALLVDGNEAEELYGEALERLARTRMAAHLARARLCYGEWLRRQSRRIEARSQLRPAYEAFEAMGAQGFAERARRELLATGEKVRKRGEVTRADLTPQEEEIAQLARDGRTNPEIGAQLFIGARTVEWHLRKVFAKLDIGSRRDLDEALRRRASRAGSAGPEARVPARDLTGATGRPGARSCGHDTHTFPGTFPGRADRRRDRRQRRHRAGDRPPGPRRGRRCHPDRAQSGAPRAGGGRGRRDEHRGLRRHRLGRPRPVLRRPAGADRPRDGHRPRPVLRAAGRAGPRAGAP